jgi:hypothetical protein
VTDGSTGYGDIRADQFIAPNNGSASSPAFLGSVTNTGMYFGTSDWKINLSIAGNQRVGIGNDRFDLDDIVVMRWATAIGGAVKCAIYAAAAGLMRLNQGNTSGTGTCALQHASYIEAKTGNDTLAAEESNTFYTNEGATGAIAITLPTAVAGYRYTFYVDAAQSFEVKASTGDTIRVTSEVSASGGNVTSGTVGSCLTLVAINATEWVAESMLGIWTVT